LCPGIGDTAIIHTCCYALDSNMGATSLPCVLGLEIQQLYTLVVLL
jgi:hypothetical protein